MGGPTERTGLLRVVKRGGSFARLGGALLLLLPSAEQLRLAQSVAWGESAAGDKAAMHHQNERQRPRALRAPLAPSTSAGGGVSGSSAVDPFEVCPAESSACYDDKTCLECVIGLMPVNETECSRLYPVLLEARVPSEPTASTPSSWLSDPLLAAECEELAALICCTFDMQEIYDCSGSELTVGYWGCGLEYKGCSIEELPCYGSIMDVVGNEMTDHPFGSSSEVTPSPFSIDVAEVTPSPMSTSGVDGAGSALSASKARVSSAPVRSGMFAFVALGVLVFSVLVESFL